MIRALWLGLVALAWIVAAPAAAKSRLFSDDAPLKIVITAPIQTLVRAAATNTNPYPAILSVTEATAPAQSLPIQLSVRGHSRRSVDYCAFPPLLLEFDKATAHGTLFQGQRKLKLTTYCRPQPGYDQHIVLEYLAYKLYNLMTPISFRVRAADVTYRRDAGDPGVTRFGFLIEDVKELAERNDRERLKAATHQVAVAQLDALATARAALFEYLVSNLDWDFTAGPAGTDCCHNSRLIAAPGATAATARAVVPAPYDFDSTGLVDPPYAETPPGIPVTRVTQRFYRGYCASNGEIAAAGQDYLAHRAEMMALIDGEARLNPEFRAKTDRFMDGFFAVLEDPARFQREVVKHCR